MLCKSDADCIGANLLNKAREHNLSCILQVQGKVADVVERLLQHLQHLCSLASHKGSINAIADFYDSNLMIFFCKDVWSFRLQAQGKVADAVVERLLGSAVDMPITDGQCHAESDAKLTTRSMQRRRVRHVAGAGQGGGRGG